MTHPIVRPSPIEPRDDVASALMWIIEQTQNGMGIAQGCASTHGDSGGGLEMLNSVLSDIEINAAMALETIAAATGETK